MYELKQLKENQQIKSEIISIFYLGENDIVYHGIDDKFHFEKYNYFVLCWVDSMDNDDIVMFYGDHTYVDTDIYIHKDGTITLDDNSNVEFKYSITVDSIIIDMGLGYRFYMIDGYDKNNKDKLITSYNGTCVYDNGNTRFSDICADTDNDLFNIKDSVIVFLKGHYTIEPRGYVTEEDETIIDVFILIESSNYRFYLIKDQPHDSIHKIISSVGKYSVIDNGNLMYSDTCIDLDGVPFNIKEKLILFNDNHLGQWDSCEIASRNQIIEHDQRFIDIFDIISNKKELKNDIEKKLNKIVETKVTQKVTPKVEPKLTSKYKLVCDSDLFDYTKKGDITVGYMNDDELRDYIASAILNKTEGLDEIISMIVELYKCDLDEYINLEYSNRIKIKL